MLCESQYFKDDLSHIQYLDFRNDIANDRIIKVSVSIEEITPILQKTADNRIDIHTGEAESIAVMLKPGYQNLYFCTADKTAVVATHLFNLLDRVVSLEKCLAKKVHTLPFKLTEKAMQKWKADAIQRL